MNEKLDFLKTNQVRSIIMCRKVVFLENDYQKTISRNNFFSNYEKKKSDLDLLMKKWEELSLS